MGYETLEVPQFRLACGAVLDPARLAYKTWGTLSERRDNAVLFPVSYASNHGGNEWLIGPGRALDPAKWFILTPNLLGNGFSSSPSNTPPPQDRSRFPAVSILDNVRLQHALLDHLGIEKLALVVGRSMGGQQAFQWGSYYPDRVRAIMPVHASAKTTPHNQAMLHGLKAALTTAHDWQGGEYTSPPKAGVRAMGRVLAGWSTSQAFYRQGLHLTEVSGARSLEDYLVKKWDENFLRCDANDLVAMIDTWFAFDVSQNERFKGDFAAALGAIRCRAIVMPSRTDLYFPPEDSAAAVELMPNAELRVIDSVWGHRSGAPGTAAEDIRFIETGIRELLQRELL